MVQNINEEKGQKKESKRHLICEQFLRMRCSKIDGISISIDELQQDLDKY